MKYSEVHAEDAAKRAQIEFREKGACIVKTTFPNPTMVIHMLPWKVPDEMV